MTGESVLHGPARRGDRPRRRYSGAHRRRGRSGLARHLRAATAADQPLSYKDILKTIGRKGDLTSKVRESLVSIGRLLLFLANEAEGMRWPKDVRAAAAVDAARRACRCRTTPPISTNKITFLLDALLGVVSLEQNNIIKIFSVAAVVLMPPTLIASIYGMNFKHMPELDWTYGYPFAIVLMVLAAILPYCIFKWKKWL